MIDYDRMRLRRPEVVYDLPAGGKRLMQGARASTRRSSRAQIDFPRRRGHRSLPGKLVRGQQAK